MGRIGIHGKVLGSGAHFIDAMPVLSWIFDQIENTINGQIEASNIAAGAVGTTQLADAAVTAAKHAVLSVTSAAVDSTVAKIATGQFTGDGTSNREISLGWRARFVYLIRHDTRGHFVALGGTASSFVRVQVDNTGVVADGGTDFTGTSLNGFTLGSAAGGGASNANAQTFSYLALG